MVCHEKSVTKNERTLVRLVSFAFQVRVGSPSHNSPCYLSSRLFTSQLFRLHNVFIDSHGRVFNDHQQFFPLSCRALSNVRPPIPLETPACMSDSVCLCVHSRVQVCVCQCVWTLPHHFHPSHLSSSPLVTTTASTSIPFLHDGSPIASSVSWIQVIQSLEIAWTLSLATSFHLMSLRFTAVHHQRTYPGAAHALPHPAVARRLRIAQLLPLPCGRPASSHCGPQGAQRFPALAARHGGTEAGEVR